MITLDKKDPCTTRPVDTSIPNIPQGEMGVKDDGQKPRMNLIDPEWELDVARGLTAGAAEYGVDNWKLVNPERYIAAAMRHLNAMRRNEIMDAKTGIPHAALASCNLMFLHNLTKGVEDEL